MKLILILPAIAAAATLTASTVVAQAPDTATLTPIVVSATKGPAARETLTQAVTVLSGEDLRRRGITRVSEALREVPGATLVQNGSYGAVTSLFLRGGESRYTKVLIDGVPVNSPGGFFDFSHLTTDNIERIEIVRGPASVVYGADAVSGIVQIFTRRGGAGRQLRAGVRRGTYRSFDADADIAAGNGPLTFTAGGATHSTDGVLPFNNQYTNGTLSSAVTFSDADRSSATISARYSAAEFHYPTDFTGAPVDSNAYRTQHRFTVGLDARRQLLRSLEGRLLAGSNEVSDLTEDLTEPPVGASTRSVFRSRARRNTAEGRLTFVGPQKTSVTAGIAYERERERSSSADGPVGGELLASDAFLAARSNVGYYGELLGEASNVISYTLSGRLDDNSDYERFSTYRLGASLRIIPALRVRAAVSTAFNAPAFNQLRPTLFTTGSPNLDPERSRTAEVGLEARALRDLLRIEANVFRQRFEDLIQYVNGGPPDFKGSFANLAGATANGYEAEAELRPWQGVHARLSYTVVEPRVSRLAPTYEGDQKVGDALIRRPSHSGTASLGYFTGRGGSISVAATYIGKRADLDFAEFPSPTVTLPSYSRVDLSGEQPLVHSDRATISLTGRVENLFDRRYEDVLRFAAPGRAVFVGLRASF